MIDETSSNKDDAVFSWQKYRKERKKSEKEAAKKLSSEEKKDSSKKKTKSKKNGDNMKSTTTTTSSDDGDGIVTKPQNTPTRLLDASDRTEPTVTDGSTSTFCSLNGDGGNEAGAPTTAATSTSTATTVGSGTLTKEPTPSSSETNPATTPAQEPVLKGPASTSSIYYDLSQDNVLDHITLAAPDLDLAIAEFEQRTGVKPV